MWLKGKTIERVSSRVVVVGVVETGEREGEGEQAKAINIKKPPNPVQSSPAQFPGDITLSTALYALPASRP